MNPQGVPCPACKAKAGESCVKADGLPVAMLHPERVELLLKSAERATDAILNAATPSNQDAEADTEPPPAPSSRTSTSDDGKLTDEERAKVDRFADVLEGAAAASRGVNAAAGDMFASTIGQVQRAAGVAWDLFTDPGGKGKAHLTEARSQLSRPDALRLQTELGQVLAGGNADRMLELAKRLDTLGFTEAAEALRTRAGELTQKKAAP